MQEKKGASTISHRKRKKKSPANSCHLEKNALYGGEEKSVFEHLIIGWKKEGTDPIVTILSGEEGQLDNRPIAKRG